MLMSPFLNWIDQVPLTWLALVLLAAMLMAAYAGHAWRLRQARKGEENGEKESKTEGQEAYIVSAVLGLLAFLLGFTFSLASDRFDARRVLVLEESNAIGTAYLRSQLLGEPHRTRLSKLLVTYTENKIALAKARRPDVPPLLARDDQLLTEIWAATAAGFDSIRNIDFSSSFVDSMNNMIDLDSSRRMARLAKVPTEVFGVLLIYMIVSSGVLGYVLIGRRGHFVGLFLMGLFTLSLMLIVDIDRPTSGNILESQVPTEQLLISMKRQPISVYDRWRTLPNAP